MHCARQLAVLDAADRRFDRFASGFVLLIGNQRFRIEYGVIHQFPRSRR